LQRGQYYTAHRIYHPSQQRAKISGHEISGHVVTPCQAKGWFEMNGKERLELSYKTASTSRSFSDASRYKDLR
jgi:hypothetical protein